MKRIERRMLASGVAAMLTLAMLPSALAAEGKVNTSSLVMRKSASKTSEAVQTLSKGDELTIKSESGDWYRVSYGKYTGYVMKKYVKVTKGKVEQSQPDKSQSGTPATPSTSTGSLRSGSSGERVKSLQTQLQAAGLYSGAIDGKFGSATENAVRAFQRKLGLKVDGVAGTKTLAALSGQDATEPDDDAVPAVSLRPGAKGEAVKALQRRLKTLTLYNGSIDGKYGTGTENAVRAFQRRMGLKVDGIAGQATLQALETAKVDDVRTTEQLDWFSHTDTIPKKAVVTIKDCKTGKTFQAKRWSGASHMDTEPLTAEDTAIMKEIYGGAWSWDRRAILVKYDGHVYAASMNGMPHGTSTIDNGFDGHFCVHFTGSKTHGTDRVDEDHQAAVAQATQYSW